MSLNGYQILEPVLPRGEARGFLPMLVSIMKSGRALLTLRLAEIGLHPGQDHMLMALDPNGEPVLVSRLADLIGVRSSTASKMLDRLELAGLVRRSHSQSDKRHTMVSLTTDGEEFRRKVDELWSDMELYILQGCSSGEADDMCRATERLDEIMTERLRRLR